MQSDLFYCKVTLHVTGVHRTHHQDHNRSKPTTRFAQTSPDLAILEGSSCTDIMTCTGGCGYSF